jgi:hypothetical protein
MASGGEAAASGGENSLKIPPRPDQARKKRFFESSGRVRRKKFTDSGEEVKAKTNDEYRTAEQQNRGSGGKDE